MLQYLWAPKSFHDIYCYNYYANVSLIQRLTICIYTVGRDHGQVSSLERCPFFKVCSLRRGEKVLFPQKCDDTDTAVGNISQC